MPKHVLQQIFLDLVAQIHKKTHFDQRCKVTTPLKIIGSSTLPLNLNNHKWLNSAKTKSSIKLQLYLVYLEKGCSYLDEIILIGTTQNRAENVFHLIKALDSKGNELHLITNRFDFSADEIAELYKSHWAIELFFKWIKQQLNSKKFYEQNEQAVHNQVYITMIVYCLHVLAQLNTSSSKNVLENQSFTKSGIVEIRPLMDSKNYQKSSTVKVLPLLSSMSKVIVIKWMFTTSVQASLFSSQYKKTGNSVKIYATLVIE